MSIQQLISGLFGSDDNDTTEQTAEEYAADPEHCDHDFPDWPDESPYAWRVHLTTPVENPDEDDVQLLATRERGCSKCGARDNEYATLAELNIELNEDGSLNGFDVTQIDRQHQ